MEIPLENGIGEIEEMFAPTKLHLGDLMACIPARIRPDR
jgi:hypothetical protein